MVEQGSQHGDRNRQQNFFGPTGNTYQFVVNTEPGALDRPGRQTSSLPSGPRPVGRRTQTALFETAIQTAGEAGKLQQIFVVHGLAGVGKTSLARYLVAQLFDRLSTEHQDSEQQDTGRPSTGTARPLLARHVDLHGLGPGRTDPTTALQQLLLLDRVPLDQALATLDGLQSAWRQHLGDRLLILLLDNADSDQQVLPFLPGRGEYVVLVTSRRPLLLAADGVTHLQLPVLPRPDAEELIATVTRRSWDKDTAEHRAATGIAEFCGDHPQAIRIAVAGLAIKPDISLAERLRELESRPNRLLAVDDFAEEDNAQVARSFELSYLHLPEDRRLLLRRLGLSPVPEIGVDVAIALSGLDRDTVPGHLRKLEANALIEVDRQRYRLHDLVREYARNLAGQDETADNDAAVDRVLAYYLDAALAVDAVLTRQPPPDALAAVPVSVGRPFTDWTTSLAWARDQRANLLACADYLERLAKSTEDQSDDGRTRTLIWVVRFGSALAGLLRNDGLWDRSIQLQTLANSAAAELDLPIGQANARHERAQLYRLSGSDLSLATNDLDDALVLFRRVGGPAGTTGEAHVLNTYGVVLDQQKRTAEASVHFEASLAIYRRLGDRLGQANVRHDQGMAHHFSQRYPEAADLLEEALALYRQVDHPVGQAHALKNLARDQQLAGRSEKAREHLAEAQELYGRLDNRLGKAAMLLELGRNLRPRLQTPSATGKDAVKAQLALEQAAEAYREIGTHYGLPTTLLELAGLHAAVGRTDLAEPLLQQALQLFVAAGHVRGEQQAREEIARFREQA